MWSLSVTHDITHVSRGHKCHECCRSAEAVVHWLGADVCSARSHMRHCNLLRPEQLASHSAYITAQFNTSYGLMFLCII